MPSLDSFDTTYTQPSSPRLDPESRPPTLGPYKGEDSPKGQRFGGEKFRGSSELPLTTEGLMKAHQLGMKLAQKGGLDRLMTSSMGRTVTTAKIISHYTHAPVVHIGDELHPWHLGGLEGQDVTPERVDFQNSMIKDHPDFKVPGRGPLSSRDGESFNDFKDRTLPFLQQMITQSRSRPEEATGLVTHYRVRKLLEAWMRKGMPEDGSIDTNEMTTHTKGGKPGSLERLVVDPYAGPQMTSVDINSPGRLGGGLYFIRHEDTPWNSKDNGSSSSSS
jgi:broad specificity phosphatase PhoE